MWVVYTSRLVKIDRLGLASGWKGTRVRFTHKNSIWTSTVFATILCCYVSIDGPKVFGFPQWTYLTHGQQYIRLWLATPKVAARVRDGEHVATSSLSKQAAGGWKHVSKYIIERCNSKAAKGHVIRSRFQKAARASDYSSNSAEASTKIWLNYLMKKYTKFKERLLKHL